MFLVEPQRTQFDVNFRLFGIPVRVHPFFWLFSLFLGSGAQEPKLVLIFVAAAFISILVHELGHAAVAMWFGWPPRITLYSMGGLASYRPTHRDPRKQILISFAGPAAGFLLALAVVIGLAATHHDIQLSFGGKHFIKWIEIYTLPGISLYFGWFLDCVLQLCIFWGIVNLLPVLPLDGGNICHELLLMFSRGNATAQALGISIITAAALAVYGLAVLHSTLMAMFFGFMAFSNFQALQMLGGGGGGYGRW